MGKCGKTIQQHSLTRGVRLAQRVLQAEGVGQFVQQHIVAFLAGLHQRACLHIQPDIARFGVVAVLVWQERITASVGLLVDTKTDRASVAHNLLECDARLLLQVGQNGSRGLLQRRTECLETATALSASWRGLV